MNAKRGMAEFVSGILVSTGKQDVGQTLLKG